MLAFPYSQHTFDEEMQIAEKMQNIQFVFNGRNLDHFKFVKSHTNRYIQISDVIVGLLGKMFSYFDANSLCDIYIKSMRISKQAKENVRKIAKLIDRSDRKSSLLIKNVNSFDVLKDREEKLEILAKSRRSTNIDLEKSIKIRLIRAVFFEELLYCDLLLCKRRNLFCNLQERAIAY